MNQAPTTRTSTVIFNYVLIAIVGIMLFFLLTEHTAHFFGILPWLFLLVCPLMMMFMHRNGHGSHGDHDVHDHRNHADDREKADEEEPASRPQNTSTAEEKKEPEHENKQQEHQHHGC